MASRRTSLKQRLKDNWEDFLIDLLNLCLFLFVLWIGEHLVHRLFGEDLLFDRFPKRWLFDAGDVALIACFTIRSARRLL